jgi:hypothetical protein
MLPLLADRQWCQAYECFPEQLCYALLPNRLVASAESSQEEPSSATFERPKSDFSRRRVQRKSQEGGQGVQPGAPTESARSESSHGILFQIGLPYPAPGALKKRRASEPQRNPEPSANALSREFTAPYR